MSIIFCVMLVLDNLCTNVGSVPPSVSQGGLLKANLKHGFREEAHVADGGTIFPRNSLDIKSS